MKFDFVIGNPPYQDETIGDNKGFAPPVYNKLLEEAYKIGCKVEMIHPARFLFNAGSTPKAWNKKMLNDPHLKIVDYEEKSQKIFSNTDIKGGIAISYRDREKKFGAIEVFTPQEQLNGILKKVKNDKNFVTMKNIVITRTAYRLSEKMHKDHPEAIKQLSDGHAFDMSSNIFDRLPQIFSFQLPQNKKDYLKILGRQDNRRVFKYIRLDYVKTTKNTFKYKVVMPKASGTGAFGETISSALVGKPGEGSTETFITIGAFEHETVAKAAKKYVQTKFARSLLGILKRTQEITPDKWQYVPLQDFTNKSDIDWSKSIKDIDKQLYKKYKLSKEEIAFIETHVKEMA